MGRCSDHAIVQDTSHEKLLFAASDFRVILLYIIYPTLDAIFNISYSPTVNNHSSKATKLVCSINECMKRAIGREMVALERQHGTLMDSNCKTMVSYLPYYFIWVAITNAKKDFTVRAVLQTILQAPSQHSKSSVRSSALAAWVAGLCLPYGSQLSHLRSSGPVSNAMSAFLGIASSVETSSVVLRAIIETTGRFCILEDLCNSHLRNLREFMATEEAWRKDALHVCESLKQELKPYMAPMLK